MLRSASVTPKPAEAANICAAIARWCRCIKGAFRVVQPEVVLADIRQQVAAGAEHITFGDPDFFNGPTHALRIVEALHRECPALTYDATIKIEHLLKHRELLPRLRETRLPVRHQRRGIGGRRGARKARQRPHARRLYRSGARVAVRRSYARAHLHPVYALDHARIVS